jgi:hypothetical protein
LSQARTAKHSSQQHDEKQTQEGAVANALAKGSRITGAQRGTLSSQYAKRYAAGESIRKIAEDAGRSFGFVHGVLKESGVQLRGRGGATRGASKTTSSAGKKATVAPTKKASASKAPAKSSATKAASASKSPAKATSKKSTASKAAAKATGKKAAAKAPAKASASKTAAKKGSTTKSAAKSPAKSSASKSTSKKSTAKKS